MGCLTLRNVASRLQNCRKRTQSNYFCRELGDPSLSVPKSGSLSGASAMRSRSPNLPAIRSEMRMGIRSCAPKVRSTYGRKKNFVLPNWISFHGMRSGGCPTRKRKSTERYSPVLGRGHADHRAVVPPVAGVNREENGPTLLVTPYGSDSARKRLASACQPQKRLERKDTKQKKTRQNTARMATENGVNWLGSACTAHLAAINYQAARPNSPSLLII